MNSQQFDSNFDKELKECNNMNEVLDCVQRHYDLSKPFGTATKLVVMSGIKKIIKLVQAVKRII